jgi:hypothetical protein
MSMRLRKVIAALGAFLIASLIPAVILGVAGPLVEGNSYAMAGMGVVFFFFSAIATLLLGVPAFLIFLRLDLIRWWSGAGAGAVVGAVMGAAVQSNPLQVYTIAIMAAMGSLSGLTFWLIWSRAVRKDSETGL